MNLSLSFQILFFVSIGIATIPFSLPSNETEIYGYADDSYIDNPTDSLIDLSDLVKYGSTTNWIYFNQNDTLIIEHRETSWKAYNIVNDSLRLRHSEDRSERTDFDMSYPHVHGIIPIQPYMGATRRQMTFCYRDSGYTEQKQLTTPILICDEGDTIKNCQGYQIITSYDRITEEPESPSIKIMEKETMWRSITDFTPYAMSYEKIITVDDNEPDSISTTIVFPRRFNEATITRNETQNNPTNNNITLDKGVSSPSSAIIGELTLSMENNCIVVDGVGEFSLSIYDTSGILWVGEENLTAPVRYNLSRLPYGEYVATISKSEKVESITILLRP